MFRRCRHAAHDHPWAVVALNEWQQCADEHLGKHRARPTAIRVSAGGPPTVQIRAARGGATACMWPCGPARAFRRGARPVHGAARPPTAGRAQDRPDPPQNRPAGAQTRWPWLGSSAVPRGRGWASSRPNCTTAMAAATAAATGRVEGADRKRRALCHRRTGQGRTRADDPCVRIVSVSPQKQRKLGPRMGRKQTQTDKSPFAPARWAVQFVRFTSNGRARTG